MRYKRGIRVISGAGRSVRIAAAERPLLELTAACLQGKRLHRWNMIDVIIWAQMDLYLDWNPCCAASTMENAYALAIERLTQLKVDHPDLAQRIDSLWTTKWSGVPRSR